MDATNHNAFLIARIERALLDVACLLEEHPALVVIFERLEAELAEARSKNDSYARARALLASRSTN
ncbi:hypothetical protein [uncultured Pelagimonas sp.]|uniref:hypothetical protein n=1 Tax=uncultured Pelagimonas sp. TaxID=1618102 RepID=UPI002609EEEA|nr:hypothetical protein [uncultured Pelagimonas sp.]